MDLIYYPVSFPFSLKGLPLVFLDDRLTSNTFSELSIIRNVLIFSFDGYSILDEKVFLAAFFICHSTAFWAPLFLMRNQLLFVFLFSCTRWVIFLLMISRISFFLWLSTFLIMVCLGVDFFRFIILGVYWTSWIWRLMFVIKFGEFLAIISSKKFFFSFSAHLLVLLLQVCEYVWHCPTGLWSSVPFYSSSFFYFFFPSLFFRLEFSNNLLTGSLVCSSANSDLLLSPFREFFM